MDNGLLHIENKIYLIRDQKVMLDSDLAQIFDVETKRLNEQVKRNIKRFPKEFMFQITKQELDSLISQNVTSSQSQTLKSQNATSKRGGRRTLPYVFTEHGTVMLASVLKSDTAVHASIEIVKAFVQFREIIGSQNELEKRLDDLENKYDGQFKQVFNAIKGLMSLPSGLPITRKGRKD